MFLGNVIRVSTLDLEPHVNPLHAGWHEGQLWVHYSSGSSFVSTFSFDTMMHKDTLIEQDVSIRFCSIFAVIKRFICVSRDRWKLANIKLILQSESVNGPTTGACSR